MNETNVSMGSRGMPAIFAAELKNMELRHGHDNQMFADSDYLHLS